MTELVEHIIVERHGFFAVRIFRLIKANQYIEQDRIAEIGMIPSKEAKHLTFKLLRDNFVKVREIRKTYNATATTNKIHFFFYVDMNEVCLSCNDKPCASNVIITKFSFSGGRNPAGSKLQSNYKFSDTSQLRKIQLPYGACKTGQSQSYLKYCASKRCY